MHLSHLCRAGSVFSPFTKDLNKAISSYHRGNTSAGNWLYITYERTYRRHILITNYCSYLMQVVVVHITDWKRHIKEKTEGHKLESDNYTYQEYKE